MAPYWYWRQLKSGWTLDESSTNRFDLPERGALSGLMVNLYGTTARKITNYAEVWPVQQTSVRVVANGNFEIMNLRGRQLHAMNFWDEGNLASEGLFEASGWANQQTLIFPFGAHLGDTDHGLWLEKFGAGVQVEETNTISTSNYTDATSKWDVFGLFRKNPEANLFSKGFFRKRQISNKTAASETQYPFKLPTEAKLKQIYVFSEPTNTSNDPSTTVYTNINKLWLSIKSKDEFLIDGLSASYFARMIHSLYGRRAHTMIYGYAETAAGHYVDTMIYERDSSQVQPVYATEGYAVEYDDNNLERTANLMGFNNAGAGKELSCYVDSEGISLHGMIPLLLIDPDKNDEQDYLDAMVNKDIYVEATEGASTGHWYIVLDELEKAYPS
jgi:hypothetical protein